VSVRKGPPDATRRFAIDAYHLAQGQGNDVMGCAPKGHDEHRARRRIDFRLPFDSGDEKSGGACAARLLPFT
jgi:hypothetical protein